MAEVAQADYPFVREVVDRAEANRRFADDPLKLERIGELGDDEVISVYTDGPFIDLCRGPHVPEHRPAQALQAAARRRARTGGAIRRRQMLQRIYGTAWFKKDDLEAHLHRLEEARKRDHRTAGQGARPVHVPPVRAGRGVLDRPRHDAATTLLNDYMRELQRDGYQEIKTPLLYNKGLWEISGHWGKYQENMFLVLDNETGEHDFSLKPMNCPSHYLMY